MNFEAVMAAVTAYLEKGGFVMPPLLLATVVLWYAIGHRYWLLRAGPVLTRARLLSGEVCRSTRGAVRKHLDEALFPLEQDLSTGRVIIKSVCVVAPLAGLLGTVTGMIETFDSLADMALFSQSGGIAGGISQALFTTQMGLVVAVPGVLAGRSLDRKQSVLRENLECIKREFALKAASGAAK